MIKIEKVQGEEQRLYDLVARLAMNKDVIKQNNNYPFWTSAKHVWFVAHDEQDSVLGFFPVLVSAGTAKINNYYVAGNKTSLINRLIKAVLKAYGKRMKINAVVMEAHVPLFTTLGFVPVRMLKRYSMMEYVKA